jgi:hypothetical protein
MRSLVSGVSAAITAVLIGLLIASVASAARAADIEHVKSARLAAIAAAADTDDSRLQLDAYHERLSQAYAQLAVAYAELQQRDAQYRTLVGQGNANAKDLATANATLESKLVAAYQLLVQFSAAAQRSSGSAGAAPVAPATQTPGGARATPGAPTTRPASAAPAATPVPTPRSTATQFCHYDKEGKWHCEDHPW